MRTRRCKSFGCQWLWVAAAVIGLSGFRLEARRITPGPMVGKAAPEFHIQGIYSEAYSLETFKGHILVMQFGASW